MKYTKGYGDFLNEGTWSYGSLHSMVKLAQELEKMAKKADDADDLLGQLESLDKKMSTIAGDDGVFDEYDTAKANAEAKDLEGAKTATYATAKAIRNLTVQIHESEKVNVLEAISKSERKEMVDYIVSMEDEIPESLWDAISDEIGTSDWSIGIKKLKDDQVQSIYNDMIDARANESSNSVDEKLVKPARGHNYYVLSKDVPVKYIVSQSNPTGATGVLLHNKKGYIDGKKGAYIIDYYGGHYYVDMENQFASPIYKLKDQDRGFRDALTDVYEAPQHADWREFMREIPFENNNSNMKHLKGYNDFLNENNVISEASFTDTMNDKQKELYRAGVKWANNNNIMTNTAHEDMYDYLTTLSSNKGDLRKVVRAVGWYITYQQDMER